MTEAAQDITTTAPRSPFSSPRPAVDLGKRGREASGGDPDPASPLFATPTLVTPRDTGDGAKIAAAADGGCDSVSAAAAPAPLGPRKRLRASSPSSGPILDGIHEDAGAGVAGGGGGAGTARGSTWGEGVGVVCSHNHHPSDPHSGTRPCPPRAVIPMAHACFRSM